MNNKYTYEVYTKQTEYGPIPLHIVEIHHRYLAAFAVFNTAKDARDYIEYEKSRLAKYGITMTYDADMDVSKSLLDLYLHANGQFFTKLANKQVYFKQIFH